MIKLRQREYEVLQMVRRGESRPAMAKAIGTTAHYITSITSRLCTLGVLERISSHQYRIIRDDVEPASEKEIRYLRSKPKESAAIPMGSAIRPWSEDEKFYLKHHLEQGISRRKLAQKFGLDIVSFNAWLMDMRIGTKDVMDGNDMAGPDMRHKRGPKKQEEQEAQHA